MGTKRARGKFEKYDYCNNEDDDDSNDDDWDDDATIVQVHLDPVLCTSSPVPGHQEDAVTGDFDDDDDDDDEDDKPIPMIC